MGSSEELWPTKEHLSLTRPLSSRDRKKRMTLGLLRSRGTNQGSSGNLREGIPRNLVVGPGDKGGFYSTAVSTRSNASASLSILDRLSDPLLLVLALVLIASYTDDLEMEGMLLVVPPCFRWINCLCYLYFIAGLDPFGQIAISIPRSSSAGWIDKINGYWTIGLFLRCLINATGCWH
jgi:hypothetical protein